MIYSFFSVRKNGAVRRPHWIRNSENTTFVTVYIILLVSLALISVLVIILKRTFYKEKLQSIWVEENKFVLTIEPILFFVMTIVIAAFNI